MTGPSAMRADPLPEHLLAAQVRSLLAVGLTVKDAALRLGVHVSEVIRVLRG